MAESLQGLDAEQAAKLSELQGGGGGEGRSRAAEQKRAHEDKISEQASMLLERDARPRLERIRLVRESQAKDVERALVRAVQMGQLRPPISEKQLISILESFNAQKDDEQAIVYSRKDFDESDDEEFDFFE
ncbi:hypothetical protein GGF46_002696 [Coemansia sp. RSA 552]|nr:hypothetical protein GGF46_002696 [Coemansia sp. RSA 552]